MDILVSNCLEFDVISFMAGFLPLRMDTVHLYSGDTLLGCPPVFQMYCKLENWSRFLDCIKNHISEQFG